MPVIERGDDHFAVVTYTGNGSTQTISGLRFQPDFVWIKSRSNAVEGPLFDAVRGTTKGLFSSLTNAEFTDNTTLTSFNSDGFTLGGNTHTNLNNYTYVAWCWKANGAGVSNTDGTISSTVSANTTAGFSIVTWTGNATQSTVGHGLGVAPKFIIVKNRTDADTNWQCWHTGLSTDRSIALNLTDSQSTDGPFFFGNNTNITIPTSTVFTVSANNQVNGSSDNMLCYAFAPIAGYSAFGSFVGSGSADGPMIFTGFRPAFVMIKRTDSTGNWTIHDNRRLGYNGSSASKELYPNLSLAEGSDSMDQLSNGFKLRDTYSDVNASGGTYIYAAFAENPFKFSLAR